MPERFVANAMLMYVKRHAHTAGQWEEITLGMKHHDFPDLVPVARWQPLMSGSTPMSGKQEQSNFWVKIWTRYNHPSRVAGTNCF